MFMFKELFKLNFMVHIELDNNLSNIIINVGELINQIEEYKNNNSDKLNGLGYNDYLLSVVDELELVKCELSSYAGQLAFCNI